MWSISLRATPATYAPAVLELDRRETRETRPGEVPRILKCERPQSSVTRCSPRPRSLRAMAAAPRAISASFFAGIVIAPCALDVRADFVLTAMSRSVPESRSLVRRFDEDVREHRQRCLGRYCRRDAVRPSCSFSREIVKRINDPQMWITTGSLLVLYIENYLVVVVVDVVCGCDSNNLMRSNRLAARKTVNVEPRGLTDAIGGTATGRAGTVGYRSVAVQHSSR